MDKELIKILKLYFSSLFARKLKFAITTDQEYLIYTNFTKDDMRLEHFHPDHVVHFCFFKNKTLRDNIFNALSFLKQSNYFINTVDMLKFLNKCKYECNILNDEFHNVILDDGENKIVIANLISDYFLKFYYKLYLDIQDAKKCEEYQILDLDYTKIDKSKVTPITIYDKKLDALSTIKKITIPCIDGFSFVSVNEYYKKVKYQGKYTIHSFYNNRSFFKVFFQFENDDINVYSYRPFMLYFAKQC